MAAIQPLRGKQRLSYELATRRINLWEGSVRSSKTVSSLMKWLEFVRTGPPGNLLMIGRTERTLKRNIIDPLVDILGKKRCKFTQGSGEIILLGRRVYVAGANDEGAQNKIRGLTLAGFYADEVSTLPESFWSMLLSRISVPGAKGFGTTNPDSPGHWLMKKFLSRASVHLMSDGTIIEKEGINLARFSFRLSDNPWLSAEYVASIEEEYTGLWYRRFILGEWVIAQGAIYDMFDPARHVIDKLPDIERIISVGVDYGTRNPFAAEMIGYAKGALYVMREYRHDPTMSHRQMTDGEFSVDLAAWLKDDRPNFICIDPSAASFKIQLHRDRMRSVVDANNAVKDGIRMVASLLAQDKLKIHKSCVGLIEEMPGYSWDDDAAAKGEDKPVKLNDHSCDALRYGIATTEGIWRGGLNAAA